jgi:hypothetical protein
LKITITKANKHLFFQAVGMPSFSLEAIEKDKFKIEITGAILAFNPTDKTMVLEENGEIFNFVKEDGE